ncbi:hypothetical protein JKI95_07175 [Corynebacterium aquatimens]|uniref:hypothetical protein n=1 Tax=Corynebacterium aquatimens TaxID=1190508 RepID=UPI002540B699|nr:hypothetical protein [Corynebacterium aquatimens]QYH19060.1 hypothetical protein JKI95_07175 [Corynebacterium aquatimens]UIZ92090.1 hypothetical protein JZY91_10580 [Corynebacterium sp. CNCTC7651]
MGTTTILGIASIFIGFALFAACFMATLKGRKQLAIGLGVAAFVFMTFVPVGLALFGAVPNPT